MSSQWLLLFLLLPAVILSVATGKLTKAGGLTGSVTALLIFLGAGLAGVAMLGLFFLMGVSATGWQIGRKERMGTAEKEKGKRTAWQVIANGGVAALLGGMAWTLPQYEALFRLMMAGSLASAAADTLSSELGTVYGKKFYNILTLKKDRCGENGVVSFEGSLIGIAGSMVIAVAYAAGFGWDTGFLWIILAGTTGNVVDSLLGATLERKGLLGNNAVNLLNTLSGALAAGLPVIVS